MKDFTEISKAFSKSGNRALLVENYQLSENNKALTYAFVGLALGVMIVAGYYAYTVIEEEHRKKESIFQSKFEN
jgi:hypothetical protein